MKFLCLADLHYTMTNPERRVDCYYESLNRKLEEIAVIAKDYDYILITGDIFHKKSRTTWIEWAAVADKLLAMKKKIFVIPGNHDLFGANWKTWEVQPLGALHKADIVTVVDTTFVLAEKDVAVAICGIQFGYANVLSDYKVKVVELVDYTIVMTHDMILPTPPPYDIHYLLVDDVMREFDGDMLINGHLHNLQYIKDYHPSKFIQLGSLARGVLKLDDKDRWIDVIGVEVKKKDGNLHVSTESIPLKMVKPFNEVFDVNAFIKEKEHDVSFQQFTEGVIEEVATTEQHDIQSLIRNMSEFKSLSKDVRETVETYLERVG